MKKIFSLFIFTALLGLCTSACNQNKATSMVKSERRFAQYLETDKNKQSGMIDLSEGPKVNYNANFGPKAPSFEFKIVDPY